MACFFTAISLKCHSFKLTSIYDALTIYVEGPELSALEGRGCLQNCPCLLQQSETTWVLRCLCSKPV